MKNAFKAFAIITAALLPLSAFAADSQTTDTPPKDTPVYPCWDMMKDGKMMHMRGMWHGDKPGNMMMMHQQDVQAMQKEIDDLRKEVDELKKKK